MIDINEDTEVIKWLLEGPLWIKYRARVDLLDQSENDDEVLSIKRDILEDKLIQDLIGELKSWPGLALKRHNDAAHLIHKLSFISHIGIAKENKELNSIFEKILTQQSDEGQFQVLLNVHERYGGSGEDELSWMLCDSPLLLYSLARSEYNNHPKILGAAEHLVSLIRDNGWPCGTSETYKGFRGPGRKDDPCPYVNLISLKALAELKEWRESEPIKIATETILTLWEKRKTKRAYLFGMGTDFKKLKAPLIWYDILHIVDVLSQFNWIHEDKRFLEMIQILKSKIGDDGKCFTESVWRAWKEWDFGQKKEPSRWITFLIYRILKRLN